MTKRLRIRLFLFFALALTMAAFFTTGTGTQAEDSPEIQAYILNNLDAGLTAKRATLPLTEVAYLTVKNTYIRETALAETEQNLDKYFDCVRSEGLAKEYVLTSASVMPLFDVDTDSEYVVGYLGEPNTILDIAFAENNDEGIVLEDEIYDSDTGLVYIKKTDLYKIVDGEILIDYVQAQTLRRYFKEEKEAFTVRQKNDGHEMCRDVVPGEIAAPTTEIKLEDSGGRKLSESDVTIRLNGAQTPIDKDCYEINGDTLFIDISPANIDEISVDVFDEKGLFAPQTVYAFSTSTADSSAFPVWKRRASVGDYCEFTGKWANGSGKSDNPGTYNAVQVISGNATGVQTDFYNKIIAGDPSVTEWITGEYSSGKPNVYKPSSSSSNTYREYKIKAGTISADSSSATNPYFAQWLGSINCTVSMSCAEVKTAASVGEGTINLSAVVSEVGSDYVLVTFCSCQRTEGNSSKPGTGQVLCGTFAIKYAPEYADIHYYANGGTVKSPFSLGTGGVIYKNGTLFSDKWDLDTTRSYGLVNASSFYLTRPGYSFSGYWNTKANGTGTSYGQDDRSVRFSSASTVNLYAMWNKNKGTVSFDVNGGSWGEGEIVDSYEIYYESVFAVPILSLQSEPKRDEYAFMGWSDSQDGEVKYDYGDVIKEKNTEPADIRLYAVWKAAKAEDVLWSEYLSSATYESSDTSDMSVKHIEPAKHHYYRFVGYFTEDGRQVTDSDGNIVDGEIEGYIRDGAFVNTEPIVLIAKFE